MIFWTVPRFERADLDCDHWLYLTAHTDIVVELSVSHLADRDRVLVNPEGLGIVPEHEVEHEHYHDGSKPVRHRLFCSADLQPFFFSIILSIMFVIIR